MCHFRSPLTVLGWEVTMDSTSLTSRSLNDATNETRPIRLAGALLGERRHVCAFFSSREDEYRVSLPFIKDGFECGDRAVHLVGSERRADHLMRLTTAGIDTTTARQTGQYQLRDWEDTYLAGGYFDPDRWMALLEEVLGSGPREGFPITRLVAHMEWALEDRVGVDRLVEYEARLNYVWPLDKDAVICTYDLTRFGGDVIIDIMRTHPLIIIGGTLHQNPFYVEPDAFLEELHARRGTRVDSPRSVV